MLPLYLMVTLQLQYTQKWDTNGRTALVVSCLKHDRCKPYVAHYCPDLLWHAQTLNTLWQVYNIVLVCDLKMGEQHD